MSSLPPFSTCISSLCSQVKAKNQQIDGPCLEKLENWDSCISRYHCTFTVYLIHALICMHTKRTKRWIHPRPSSMTCLGLVKVGGRWPLWLLTAGRFILVEAVMSASCHLSPAWGYLSMCMGRNPIFLSLSPHFLSTLCTSLISLLYLLFHTLCYATCDFLISVTCSKLT